MALLRLTDISLAQSTAITPTTLIHIVTTGDTTQFSGGSSYKAELGQLTSIFSGSPQIYTTAFTYSNNTFTIFDNSGSTFSQTVNDFSGLTINGNLNVTGDTILNNITATTISATTYQNLPIDPDTYTTAFTYNNNTFTISDNSGSTFSQTVNDFTGLTINGNLTITGNTTSQGLTANTISATTYQNLPIDPDTYTTGFTYSANTFTILDNSGNTFNATISDVTGLTVNGGLSATTLSAVTIGSSGDCVDDLYVSNIHSCSPLYINPLSEGNVFVGSANTLTVDLTNERVGISITSPTAKLHINNTGSTNTVLFEDDTNPDSSPFVVSNTGRVGIGMTTPTAKLHISGETTGTTQYTLKLDDSSGNGNLWVRDDGVVFYGNGGGSPAKFISAGPANSTFVSVGYNVLNNFTQNAQTGIGAVGFGIDVLKSLPAIQDGIGFGSGVFANTSLTGGRNIGFGKGIGAGITSGNQNLLFGYNTANNFTTGNYNIQMAHQVGGGNYSSTLAFGHDFNLKESNTIMFGGVRQYKSVQWDDDVTDGTFSFSTFTEKIASVANASTSNTNGWDWTYEGSKSTGQGTGGAFIWKTTPSGVTSSSTQNTLVEAMRITGEGNIGIGTSSPSSKLEVSGRTITTNFTMTSGATNGYVLTSDVSGNASWSPSTGGGSFTGGTVTGATIFTGGVSANTISATTYQSTISNTQVVYSNNGTLTGSTAMTWTNSATTLSITGTLEATSKSFVIPHPTKEGKKLVYGSLEGPENGVYHRGKLTNENTILLPEYWSKLVDKNTVTVNLTPIGRFQNLYVKEVLSDKIIVDIESGLFGNKTIECYYTVYGERKDTDKLVIER